MVFQDVTLDVAVEVVVRMMLCNAAVSHSCPSPAPGCLHRMKRSVQVFTDGLEVMSNMGAVVDSLFTRVQKNLVQTI